MTLVAGARLGPYEILAAIGAGGMGEVYRARDTKLNRDVAIKVLPDSFAMDPEHLARFQREAQVLASLNHPNIGGIYGLQEANDVRALVLELVEGPTLADRIAQMPIPVDEAFPIARQIAEALEAAHEAGIIHRDLKPANIKVRPDGTVKVLDFGLAKALDAAPTSTMSQSPTITTPAATRMGVILGTAAYMSPEQAKGKPVDKRTDIWAFGCVFYEMLTGKRAFGGDDVTDTIAAVVRAEPDWGALPANAPASIRKLLRGCLQKDRHERVPDIAVARLEIREAITVPTSDAVSTIGSAQPTGWSRALPWAVAGALGVGLALVLMLWAPWRNMLPPAPVRVSAELGADASLVTDQGAAAVLSPDGAVLVFVAQKRAGGFPQLYVRKLEQLQAAPLAGTDGARNPFFSPDGRWIAFFAGGKLKKVSATGGAAVTLCDAPNGRGGTWFEDGSIIFAPSNLGASLWRVSSAGGTPVSVTTLSDGEVNQRWPQVLPEGKAILYTTQGATAGVDRANIVVQPLPSGPRKIVQRHAYYGRYLSSGHLIYLQDGTLFAARFDLNSLELVGQPVPALQGVASNFVTGAQFAAAGNGTLVYVPGQSGSNDAPIYWMDRSGKTMPLRPTLANWSNPAFSPDGRRLAVDIYDGKQSDVWLYDWMRDALSRLTFDASDDAKPVWTPNGRRIAFSSMRADQTTLNLYWQRADGSGEVDRLTDSKNTQIPYSWHPTGKFLAFVETNPNTGPDLMILPMDGDEGAGWKAGKPAVFLNSTFIEAEPMFSPDGRWIAYRSNESGQAETYVRPFPGPGGKWQISTGGGVSPMWSRTRHELFYGTTGERIMVTSYTQEGDSFIAEKPRLWSDAEYLARQGRINAPRSFDLHPDGERFALAPLAEPQTGSKQDKLVFIFNFFDELRRIAPVAKR